jgi:nucleoside-diphosphate-sugar epimerase
VAKHFKERGYGVVAIVRPTTDAAAIAEIADTVIAGDLSNQEFMNDATTGCVAILNFLSQLMPPKETCKEQLENDLPPLLAGLQAALHHGSAFVHVSGNFSIPTAVVGVDNNGLIRNELPEKPLGASILDAESWSTFAHIGGLQAVDSLAEAKHREDHAVNDFVTKHLESKARVVIPAGIYGPGIGTKFSFWDLAAQLYLNGQFGDFHHAFVHVDDFCKVLAEVVEHGEPGGRYPVYGEPMTIRDFVRKYAKICEVPMHENGSDCLKDSSIKRLYDDSETRKLFSIQYTHSLEDDHSLKDSIDHLRERGLLQVQLN